LSQAQTWKKVLADFAVLIVYPDWTTWDVVVLTVSWKWSRGVMLEVSIGVLSQCSGFLTSCNWTTCDMIVPNVWSGREASTGFGLEPVFWLPDEQTLGGAAPPCEIDIPQCDLLSYFMGSDWIGLFWFIADDDGKPLSLPQIRIGGTYSVYPPALVPRYLMTGVSIFLLSEAYHLS